MKLEKEVNICNVYNNHGFSTLDLERIFTEEEIDIIRKMYFERVKLTLEVEEPILDDDERKYLSGVIRPFTDRVGYIKKSGVEQSSRYYIFINLIGDDPIQLPYFEKGKMYKGMELDKKYSVKELGL